MRTRAIYRSPGEPMPRANANGSLNVVRAGSGRGMGVVPIESGGYSGYNTLHPRPCPAWGCDDGPTHGGILNWSWNGHRTPQPPPTGPITWNQANNLTPPILQPSPTVSAGPENFGPSQGVPPAQLASAPAGILATVEGFLKSSTIFSSYPNWMVVAAGVGAFMFLGGGKGKR